MAEALLGQVRSVLCVSRIWGRTSWLRNGSYVDSNFRVAGLFLVKGAAEGRRRVASRWPRYVDADCGRAYAFGIFDVGNGIMISTQPTGR